jgi:hypothetical protein
VGVRRVLIDLLCAAFRSARIRVRVDGGFATPEVFSYARRRATPGMRLAWAPKCGVTAEG